MDYQAKILIAEDDEAIRDILTIMLELQGHITMQAENGREALDLLSQANFDLVLLDIMMPVMDGYETLQAIKGDRRWRNVPIVVVSSLDDLSSVVRCIELGAEDYIFKPFDKQLLEARVNASLQKKQWHDQEKAYLEQLEQERQKSEMLLLNILPAPISKRLKQGEDIIADSFAQVTVLFADIVDFTELSATWSPVQIVSLLNQIFSCFDDLVDAYHLEKIKTIGDNYMIVGGIPQYREDHAHAVASMALDMMREIRRIGELYEMPLRMRMGISSGPVVAGIIGKKKFAYDLWGDTVNTASRMEANSLPDRIQVNEATYSLLKSEFLFEQRGLIEIKGKGKIPAYFLKGHKPANNDNGRSSVESIE